MKNILFLVLILCIIASCKKSNTDDWIYGTVVLQGGCTSDAWLVEIENPNAQRHSFICEPAIMDGTMYNCRNSIVILNMPSSLATTGKKIKFSKFVDMGILCRSSTSASHNLTIEDLEGR